MEEGVPARSLRSVPARGLSITSFVAAKTVGAAETPRAAVTARKRELKETILQMDERVWKERVGRIWESKEVRVRGTFIQDQKPGRME